MKSDTEWHWLPAQEKAFQDIKALLVCAPVLKLFDEGKEIVIETDGLGACLFQEGHPVADASRSLTASEQKYARIEKEPMAIVSSVRLRPASKNRDRSQATRIAHKEKS